MSNKAISVYAEAWKREQSAEKPPVVVHQKNSPVHPIAPVEKSKASLQNPSSRPTQKVTQISNRLSNSLSKNISTEDIERMSFELRKVRKFRVNADVPEDWKKEIDSLAFRLGVGKYELLGYVIGQFLGKVHSENST